MKDLVRMIVVLTTICLVAALALSQVFALTKGPIAHALRMEKLAAIKAVLPSYDNEPDRDSRLLGERTYYPATENGSVVGVAFEAVSPDGYSGNIRVMVGVLPDGQVKGLEILEHKETPGLGQKIEKAAWRDCVVWKDKAKTTRRTLENTTWEVKKYGGEVDQISGATISPRAVVRSVGQGLKDFDGVKSQLTIAPPALPEPAATVAADAPATEVTPADSASKEGTP